MTTNLILPALLAGRCANGNERGRGGVVHAVGAREVGVFGGGKSLEIPDYSKALCGKTHGARSAGWAIASERDIDCPACLKKYRAAQAA